jgi:hypothetical protein
MKKKTENTDKKQPKSEASAKQAYDFGTIEKVTLEAQELEQSIFACMHGTDGCDPRIGTVCS